MLTQSLDIDNVIMLGNPDRKVIDSKYYKMFGVCFRIEDMEVKSYVGSPFLVLYNFFASTSLHEVFV